MAAWLTIGLALVVAIFWRIEVPRALARWDVRGTKPLTGLTLVLFSAAVLFVSHRERSTPIWIGRACALIGTLIAIASAFEYCTPLHLGLGAAVASWITPAHVADPRMAPTTAVGFIFIGLSLLLLGVRPSAKQCPGQWLALAPMMLSLVAVVGHSYGVSEFYRFGSFSSTAPLTAVGILLLSVAAILSRPLHYPTALLTSENFGGYVARRVVPAAVLFPIVAGWLRLQGELHGYYGSATGVALFAVANVLFFTLLVAFVAQKLATLDTERGESAALFRGTIEGTEDFVAVLDRNFRWKAFNDAHRREFEAIYGRVPQLGQSMLEAMGVAEDVESGRVFWGRALAGETYQALEPFGDPQRVRKWYEIRFTPVRDIKGRIIAAAQIARDMTPWHDTQEKLRLARDQAERSQREQQAIVHSMAEGVIVFDASGKMVEANRSALAMLGFPDVDGLREQLGRGDGAFAMCDPSGAPVPLERWPHTRALRGETFTNYEIRLQRGDRSHPMFVAFGGAAVRNAEGEIVLAVVTMRDITQQREAEQQLAQAKRQLEEHARNLEKQVQERTATLTENLHEMERFSYSLSHDMRAPLRAMKGFSQMLELEHAHELGETGKMYLGRISAAAGRLDRLIQDVLTYSRIVRERIDLEPVNVDLLAHQLIDENPAFQPPQAEVVIDGRLAPMTGHVAYLTQVLANLIGNAVKFVAPGEKPRVRLWSTEHDGKVRLHVQDHGIGIDRGSQAKLFGMFERLNPSYEGTGIGLNIVRKAVERMRGTVGIESEPGRGATFWVELGAAKMP